MILDIEAKYPENFAECSWQDCPDDWATIVTEALESMIQLEPAIRFTQYKEKFHGLRIYYKLPGVPFNDPRCRSLDDIVLIAENAVSELERAKNRV